MAEGTFGAAGQALWESLTTRFTFTEEEQRLLVEACRVADRLDALAGIVDECGVIVGGKPNPALVEARQQQIVLARLVAALRIPDEQGDQPQRRGGVRGIYKLGVPA